MPLSTAKRRFTEQMLERMNPPKVGRLELGDSLCPGLVLRVTPQGTKTLAVIYRVHGEGGLTARGRPRTGRQHRVTLGRWPIIKLTDAREKARGILAAAGEGQDVRAEQRAALLARQENTLTTVVGRYIEQDARLAISSWRNAERVLRLHVLPSLGDRQIEDIRRSDVHALPDDIVTSGRTGTAREVRKHLLRLFGWALDREIIFSNPLDGLKRADLTANGEAGRALTDLELKAIWKAAQDMAYPFGNLYQALMLTGQRRAEWAASKHSEFNEEERLLEVPHSPTRSPALQQQKGRPRATLSNVFIYFSERPER
jgi:hypothetical protein